MTDVFLILLIGYIVCMSIVLARYWIQQERGGRMTECPKCKGYGIVGSAVPDILRGRGAIFSSNECDMCHGSGEVPMTNEEWFTSLSTEEKARFLEMICYSAWGDKNSRFKDMADYTDWMEWLKEKHQ